MHNILNNLIYPLIVGIISSLFSQLIGFWLVKHNKRTDKKHKHKD